MDATRILGGLMAQRARRSAGSGSVLSQVLNGIASATQSPIPDPRFAPQHHAPLESMVRESIVVHHRAGGQLPPNAVQWSTQYGSQYQAQMPNTQHHHGNHCSGLGNQQRAELLVQAMIIAAQADGMIDAVEQDRIIQQLQPLSPQEVQYLRQEFARGHDVRAFAQAVPPGMEYEVYQVSLMAMNLDTPQEAQYLRDLAQCLRIAPQVCNQLHLRVGAPTIF